MKTWELYEYYCQEYLILSGKYREVWTWQNIPERELLAAKLINSFEHQRLIRNRLKNEKVNTLKDLGIDLLAKNDDGYLIIQAKCYSGKNQVKIKDLAGFMNYYAMQNLKEHQFRVFYTSRLSQPIRESVICGGYGDRLTFEKLVMDSSQNVNVIVDVDADADADASIDQANDVLTSQNETLRDYQIEAVNALTAYFINKDDETLTDDDELTGDNDDNLTRIAGILAMPGGTGKTVIYAKFASTYYKYCVVLSPTRLLAEQNLARVRAFYSDNCFAQLIDCDGSRNSEWLVTSITNAIDSNQTIVISSTYQSSDVILEVVVPLLTSQPDCLLIVDEFHDIPKIAIFDSEHQLGAVLRQSRQVLFVSATPRCYALENENISVDIASNQSSETNIVDYLFGERVYELSFSTAVANGNICDYQLWLPSVWETAESESQFESVAKSLNLNPSLLESIDQTRYVKMTVLLNWMLQVGLRRVIVYVLPDRETSADHRSAEMECELFSKLVQQIANDYHSVMITTGTILGKTSQMTRKESLDKFANGSDDVLNILFNCRVLDEGIDIPSCDGIFIAYGSRNKVRNIQRLYRCLRRTTDKRLGHCLYWGDDESRTVEFLSSIKEIDSELQTKIKIQSTNYNERPLDRAETIKNTDKCNAIITELIVMVIPYNDFLKLRRDTLVDFLEQDGRVPIENETCQYQNRVITVGLMYRSMKHGKCNKYLLEKLIKK